MTAENNTAKIGAYLVSIVIVATLGGLLFGYDTAVISGTVSSLNHNFVDPLNLGELQANSRSGMIVSSALVGCIIGGLNFDAKVRRQSIDPEDLFYAHIGAMDAFARGLKNAAKMLRDKRFEEAIQKRYAGWDTAFGRKIEKKQVGFKELEAYTLKNGEPIVQSGQQEMLENMLNEYI